MRSPRSLDILTVFWVFRCWLVFPVLLFALWKIELPVELKIAGAVAAIMYLLWLFSSQQLRYLLPIVPVLAIAVTVSVERLFEDGGIARKAMQFSLAAGSAFALLVSVAWFCQIAPLRVVLGGESRDAYLARNLDYYPYYQYLNTETPADAKVWLINIRRDTYNLDRPVVADYLFEDWTLRKMVWESRNPTELKAQAAGLGVQYILTRHDFMFDYANSSLIDDKKPRAENEAKLRMARDLVFDPANIVRSDDKFSLVRVF
jgi:signal transduction histidine kinase